MTHLHNGEVLSLPLALALALAPVDATEVDAQSRRHLTPLWFGATVLGVSGSDMAARTQTSTTTGAGALLVFGTLADVPREPASQDPLGFGPAAERLADVFAPDLTVNTRSVRYFELLAAGAHLAADTGAPDPRAVMLRLERLWALASFLADPGQGERPRSGLVGISRVRLAVRQSNKTQKLDYSMFQGTGQARYGVLGLYRRSSERLAFLRGLAPTDEGSRLSAAMVQELDRLGLRRAALGRSKTAPTSQLTAFGRASGLFAQTNPAVAQEMWDALRREPQRRAGARALMTTRGGQEDLLKRLTSVPLVATAAIGALAFEDAFAALSRFFDAAIKLAKESATVDAKEIRNSQTLQTTLKKWRAVVAARCSDMAAGDVDPQVIALCSSFAASTDPWQAVELLVERHQDVQQAKDHRQPWLDWHGARLVRSAATPNRSYDPFDLDSRPPEHDLRVQNLRQLAKEIRKAGVKLT